MNKDEQGWLLEGTVSGTPVWLCWNQSMVRRLDFTIDASKAIRFSRESDAVQMLDVLNMNHAIPGGILWKATGHEWVGPEPDAEAAAEAWQKRVDSIEGNPLNFFAVNALKSLLRNVETGTVVRSGLMVVSGGLIGRGFVCNNQDNPDLKMIVTWAFTDSSWRETPVFPTEVQPQPKPEGAA